MTDLSWLVAVLKPRDVAAHLNFRDKSFDSRPSACMAALVLGDGMRLSRAVDSGYDLDALESIDPALPAVARLFQTQTQRGALAEINNLLTIKPDDPARHASLTLTAVCAAAELDQFDLCFELLEKAITIVPPTGAGKLIRASLLVQRSLRQRDAGMEYWHDAIRAHRILTDVVTAELPTFRMSPGVSWGSRDSLNAVVDLLLSAARSNVPSTPVLDIRREHGMLDRFDEVRRNPPRALQDVSAERLRLYRRDLEADYAVAMHSESRQIFRTGDPDFYFTTLAYELAGHASALNARQELALHRFTRSEPKSRAESTADSLRLLRHSRSPKELSLAVEHVRESGPLQSLSRDARQILEQRLFRLSNEDLIVLRGAAELLTEFEADRALTPVLKIVSRGGIPPLGGSWQADALQIEPAFLAAVALGQACGRTAEAVHGVTFWASRLTAEDQLWNRSIMRALQNVDWSTAGSEAVGHLLHLIDTTEDVPPDLLDFAFAVGRSAGISALQSSARARQRHSLDRASNLDAVVDWIYSDFRARTPDEGHDRDWAMEVIDASIAELRANAHKGMYSFGGIDVADLAAGAIADGGILQLWNPLTDLLLDPFIMDEKKNLALDRLADSGVAMPAEVRKRFAGEVSLLLNGSNSGSPWTSDDWIVPNPHAVRFLITYGLVSDREASDLVLALLGGTKGIARHEGARCLEHLTRTTRNANWLAIAMQATYDKEIRVRVLAARALLNLSSETEFEAACVNRVVLLLGDDGLLMPVQLLKSSSFPDRLPPAVAETIRQAIQFHPSSRVRRFAASR